MVAAMRHRLEVAPPVAIRRLPSERVTLRSTTTSAPGPGVSSRLGIVATVFHVGSISAAVRRTLSDFRAGACAATSTGRPC
jgi:hypothetical protein